MMVGTDRQRTPVDNAPRPLQHKYVVKPTWGLAWGLFWRILLISLLFYIPIVLFLWLIPIPM